MPSRHTAAICTSDLRQVRAVADRLGAMGCPGVIAEVKQVGKPDWSGVSYGD